MRIKTIELRLVSLPLVQSFETSFGRVDHRSFILVAVGGDEMTGVGECVAGDDPYYSAETNDTAWHILVDFVAPRVLGMEFEHARDIFPALKAIRGHNMAKAGLEMAAWDLQARETGVPLWQLLCGQDMRISSGVSIGIQDTLDALAAKVETELAAGYRRIKIKIKPGWDLEPVRMIRSRFGAVPLMVDANAAYVLEDADHLAQLDAFDLMMIEQPLDYDDLLQHARLQERLRTPICLDESIKSVALAQAALDVGACRIINIKPGRMGGFSPSIKLHDLCADRDIAVWHGGMLESGIGRAHNLHLSTLSNFTLPGDIAASRRYFQPDLIDPPIDVAPDGTIAVPAGVGTGVQISADRVEAATTRRQLLSAS